MKIKTNNSSIKLKALLIFFVPVFAISLVARCIQIATIIDASTGFYTKSSFITGFLNGLLLFSVLFFIVASFISKDSSRIKTTEISSKPLYGSTFIFAIFVLISCANTFFKSMRNVPVITGVSAFREMMSSGLLPDLLQSIFALISGIYFITVASSFKTGSDNTSKHKLQALAPVGWVAFRIVGLFVKKISFIKVSDLFFELIMLGLMMLFFMAFAQITSNVYSENVGWRIFGLGLPAALIAAVLSVSKLIFTLVDSSRFINKEYPFNMTDLMFAIFVFTLCVVTLKNQNKTIEITDGCE